MTEPNKNALDLAREQVQQLKRIEQQQAQETRDAREREQHMQLARDGLQQIKAHRRSARDFAKKVLAETLRIMGWADRA